MEFADFTLSGNCKIDLDTEIRYIIASAKFDGAELVRLCLIAGDDEKDNKRLLCCATKVLRSMKRGGQIQFFVNREGFAEGTQEASFLLNKYSQYITKANNSQIDIFVKT